MDNDGRRVLNMNRDSVSRTKRNGGGEAKGRPMASKVPTRSGSGRGMCSSPGDGNIEDHRRALEAERWALMLALENTEFVEAPAVADEMETSSLEHERHVALDSRSRKAMLLGEVNEALARIAARVYGLCEECGEPMSAARLNALPWARLCLKCQEEQEMGGGPGAGESSLVALTD